MITLLSLAASSLIWGAVLVGAVIALQSRSELSGRARQWIWRGAAMLLVLPWLAVPLIDVFAPDLVLSLKPATEIAAGTAAGQADAVVTSLPLEAAVVETVVADRPAFTVPWIEILVAAIVAGWLLRFGAAQFAALRMRRLLQSATPAPEGASRDALNSWTERLLLRRKPDLRVMEAGVSPFSSGALRPVICLPSGIEQKVRPEALGLIVGHECIHVARGDGWWRPAERAVADVLWFNPFAWAIRRELDLARELACDEAVVAASSSRRAYARTLRDVAGMVSGLPMDAPATAMSIGGGSRVLAMRMKRTLGAAGRAPGRAAIAGAIILAFAAAPMAIAQALLIEAAQPPAPPEAPPAPEAPEAVEVAEARPAAEAPPVPEAPPAPAALESPQVPPAPPAPAPAPPVPATPRIGAAPRAAVTMTPRAVTEVTRVPTTPVTPPTPVMMLVPHTPATPPVPAVTPAPPAPPQTVLTTAKPGEMLRIWFPAHVVALKADKNGAYTVKLVQTEAIPAMESCTAMMTELTDIRVTQDQKVAAGAEIGVLGEDTHMQVSCQNMKVATQTSLTGVDAAQLETTLERVRTKLATAPRVRVAPLTAIKVGPIELRQAERLQRAPAKLEGAPSPVLEMKARRTSGFGVVKNPATGETGLHEGIDLAARLGTPVHTPGPATVTFAADKGKYGYTVELKLDSGATMRFAHLEEMKVAAGETIKAGDVIGTVGDDEFTTGPHLHLEYRWNGHPHDPEKVEGLNLTAPD